MGDYSILRPAPGNWTAAPVPRMLATEPNIVSLGAFVRNERRHPLRALVSVDLYDAHTATAGHWLHVSVSRPNRLPTWADLVLAKEELGYDLVFVQLLPPRSAWLNVHSYCLHLFSRLDAETLPRVVWDQEGADGAGYRTEGTAVGRQVT